MYDTPQEPSEELDQTARAVIGAAIEVHRLLGPGFLESVDEKALLVELRLRNIPVETQVAMPLIYKGHTIAEFRLDLLVDGLLVIEL